MVKMWGLWLLIFNFYTGSWEPAPIKGAVWFEKQETCIEVMAEYNRMMMMTNTAFRFVCEDQELILLGDHVYDVVDEYSIVTNLSCPECEALVFVHQKAKDFKGEYQ